VGEVAGDEDGDQPDQNVDHGSISHICLYVAESPTTEKSEHNHRDKTSNDVESDANIVVDGIHLQSSGSKIKNTTRAPTTALSFTSASFVAVSLVIGVIGDLKEVVQVEKDGEDNHQEYIAPTSPHVMPDSLVGGGYVEVALEGDGHQGVSAGRVGNLEKGVGVDHEDRAEVILEVSREFRRGVINQACCQCEDIDEREQDEHICKSWGEVEAVASAEQDCQADEIAYDA